MSEQFKEIFDGYVKAQLRLRAQNFGSRSRAVNGHDQREKAEPENNERFSNERGRNREKK